MWELMELPLGEIRPAGWLERQLKIQAKGLTGRLEEVWKDVGPDMAGSGEAGVKTGKEDHITVMVSFLWPIY